ncbi:AGE family epimerase/isomerase [Eleftheria terrae]|uniref:AGE family epimerase/isomerase n=1 Tax=Eleftheria terrae TaxID=1597781 RepID=UPI00263ABDE2|nr:AGE family epimerase/isomerase [Eleftheria terrae]WKB55838.1 AGE family epimerase/isomerase [Eleftheria terrae]
MTDISDPQAAGVLLRGQDDTAWHARLHRELQDCILPYWAGPMRDPRGGFFGGRDTEGRLRDDLPRTAVLGARVLWTFATAARAGGQAAWLDTAAHAWRWLRTVLWDERHEGVYWSVDADGRALQDHKHSYAQAFAIYASAAYARLGQPDALALARRLFTRLEAARDIEYGGYYEGCRRDWQPAPGLRLSEREPDACKTTNTLLHLLEAFTELQQVAAEPAVADRLGELVDLFLARLWRPEQRAFGMFFERDWRPIGDRVSYGHDIEAAWLLHRAAQVLGDPARRARVRELVPQVASAVLERGVAPDGSLWTEGTTGAADDRTRQWWCQAEAMVGFHDAWSLSGHLRFAQAARGCWDYITAHFTDPRGGDWFKQLDEQGRPVAGHLKAGPWECPYHHARACLEMMQRLAPAAE